MTIASASECGSIKEDEAAQPPDQQERFSTRFTADAAREGSRWAVVRGSQCSTNTPGLNDCNATQTDIKNFVQSLGYFRRFTGGTGVGQSQRDTAPIPPLPPVTTATRPVKSNEAQSVQWTAHKGRSRQLEARQWIFGNALTQKSHTTLSPVAWLKRVHAESGHPEETVFDAVYVIEKACDCSRCPNV